MVEVDDAFARNAVVLRILVLLVTGLGLAFPLAVAWLVEGWPGASALLSVSLVGEILLIALLVLLRFQRRESALKFIAAGGCPVANSEIARLAGALNDRTHIERLAADLGRALHHAENLHELPVATRPPESLRRLTSFRGEVEQIILLLQGASLSLRGLALLKLSLLGGYGSVLYAGDMSAVREQLWRIRFLLNQAPGCERP